MLLLADRVDADQVAAGIVEHRKAALFPVGLYEMQVQPAIRELVQRHQDSLHPEEINAHPSGTTFMPETREHE